MLDGISTHLKAPERIAQLGLREGSQADLMLRRFLRNKLGVIGLAFAILYVLLAITGPMIAPHDPSKMDTTDRFADPSVEHPFGTDSFGRDILSRTLVGTRISFRVASLVVTVSTVLGVLFGLLAGYFGGWVDEAIMRIVDILFAFPSILLALVIIAILGPGLDRAILALSIAYTPIMVRITRGSALSVRQEEYVMAAISYGESHFGIMLRDMLPNLLSAVVVQATITFATATLAEAGLSFLGLSAQPPTPTWGVMISQGQTSILLAPWASLFPGLAIMMTVLGLTFLGVGLRDTFDPKTDVDDSSMGAV